MSIGVSMVVPVRDRVRLLDRLLASLAPAVARVTEPVEMIVVDDSGPVAAAAHRRTCSRYGARYVRGPRHVGAKRNAGVAVATGDLILFVDSDCRATPELLSRHLAAMRAAPPAVAASAGPTEVEGAGTAVFDVMRRSVLLNGDLERPRRAGRVPWATTSNLMVRADAFRAVGGFVERSLTAVGGEDVDFGLRLTAAGYEIQCEPPAVVVHDRSSSDSLRAAARRLYTYGRSEQWLATVHPHYRRARLNAVSALGAAALAAGALSRPSRGRSWTLPAALFALLLAREVPRRCARGEPPTAVLEATACTLVDWTFDLGAAVAAVQLGRPRLLFAGFRLEEDR